MQNLVPRWAVCTFLVAFGAAPVNAQPQGSNTTPTRQAGPSDRRRAANVVPNSPNAHSPAARYSQTLARR
jgi:hypothetical protein